MTTFCNPFFFADWKREKRNRLAFIVNPFNEIFNNTSDEQNTFFIASLIIQIFFWLIPLLTFFSTFFWILYFFAYAVRVLGWFPMFYIKTEEEKELEKKEKKNIKVLVEYTHTNEDGTTEERRKEAVIEITDEEIEKRAKGTFKSYVNRDLDKLTVEEVIEMNSDKNKRENTELTHGWLSNDKFY